MSFAQALFHPGRTRRVNAVMEPVFPMNHSLSNLGRRPSCEVELKLAAPVAELEKLERALLALPWNLHKSQIASRRRSRAPQLLECTRGSLCVYRILVCGTSSA